MQLKNGIAANGPPHAFYPLHRSADGYSFQCLSNSHGLAEHTSEIERLRLRSSSSQNITARPDWVSGISPLPGCARRTILLRHNGNLKAVLYLNERLVLGVPTGYFRGCGMQGNTLIICEPGRESHLLALATEALLASHLGFLVLLQQHADDSPALLPAADLYLRTTASVFHWQVPLVRDFDTTIADFGHRTRRNLRHALRYAVKSNWHYLPDLDAKQLSAAFADLAGRSAYIPSDTTVSHHLRMVQETPGWFAMGLTDEDGHWLSCMVGYRTPQATEVFWQLNALGYRATSLCMTMRAMMMQEEIRRGTSLVRYIGGTCDLMQHCCSPSEQRQTLIGRPGIRLWLLRLFVRAFAPKAPILSQQL